MVFPTAGLFSNMPEPRNQWKMSAGSGSTLTDSAGSADATLNGPSWTSSADYVDGWAIDGDGVDDYCQAPGMNDFGSEMDSNFSWAVTIQTTEESEDQRICTTLGSDGTRLDLQINPQGFDHGGVRFKLDDTDANTIGIDIDGNVNDGNLHRIVGTKGGNAGDDFNIYVDNSLGSVNNTNNEGFNNTTDFDRDFTFMARNDGSINTEFPALMDNFIIWPVELTAEQVTIDYNNQPWT